MVDTQHGIPTLESMNGWIPEVREGLVQMIFRISIGWFLGSILILEDHPRTDVSG